jgi:hypothetical protein
MVMRTSRSHRHSLSGQVVKAQPSLSINDVSIVEGIGTKVLNLRDLVGGDS